MRDYCCQVPKTHISKVHFVCFFNAQEKESLVSFCSTGEKQHASEPKLRLPVVSTCRQPGFTQRLPTLAYGKHKQARTCFPSPRNAHMNLLFFSVGLQERGRPFDLSFAHVTTLLLAVHKLSTWVNSCLVTPTHADYYLRTRHPICRMRSTTFTQ